jgi:polyhydroxyalkanoate synthesis regulator phasin
MAAKRGTSKGGTAKRGSTRRSGSARSGSTGGSRSDPTTGLDKSIESFRNSLERSLTISRDRLQEVVDDAVKRGRMQRRDAEKMVSDLVSRGRRQTSSLVADLERLADQVRGRARPARRQATRAARRASRAARDAADRPLAEADRLRRRTGLPSRFPITAYNQLTAAQVRSRLGDLSATELRRVRDYERRNQDRKGVVTAIDRKLG